MERVQEILNEEIPQERKDNYEKMYQELFKEITNALEILQKRYIWHPGSAADINGCTVPYGRNVYECRGKL